MNNVPVSLIVTVPVWSCLYILDSRSINDLCRSKSWDLLKKGQKKQQLGFLPWSLRLGEQVHFIHFFGRDLPWNNPSIWGTTTPNRPNSFTRDHHRPPSYLVSGLPVRVATHHNITTSKKTQNRSSAGHFCTCSYWYKDCDAMARRNCWKLTLCLGSQWRPCGSIGNPYWVRGYPG